VRLAGYYGRWVDDALNWFYSVFSSIPYLLLIFAGRRRFCSTRAR
jgi:peptide/nickel transport system permease protein